MNSMLIRIIIFVFASLILVSVKYLSVTASLPKLGYRMYILAPDGRKTEFVSGIACFLFWCGLFTYDLFVPTILIVDSNIFSLLIGWMAGISLNTIYTVRFMPRGLYENGIMTETKAIFYLEIERYDITTLKNKEYKKYTFYLHNSTKRSPTLFVHKNDQKIVNTNLRKHLSK